MLPRYDARMGAERTPHRVEWCRLVVLRWRAAGADRARREQVRGATMAFIRPTWPGGARCAVALSFDNFGESFDLLRYGHAGGAMADGVYATRRGIERILDLLGRHQIPATF